MAYKTQRLRYQAAILRCQLEILRDISSGQVPGSVHTWEELDSCVDADTYGGAVDEGGEDSPSGFLCNSDWFSFWWEVRQSVDTWLREGRSITPELDIALDDVEELREWLLSSS